MKAADIVKYPLWTLALASGAKSFRDNKVIGSPALNQKGLHVARIKLAHGLAWSRRRRLAHLVSPEDRAAFDRDGYIAKHDFLDPESFAALKEQALAHRATAREMVRATPSHGAWRSMGRPERPCRRSMPCSAARTSAA